MAAIAVVRPFSVQAQLHHVRFDRLPRDGGLTQINISSIVQDHKGFLWLGSMKGLSRYDGYRFKPYVHDPNNARSLADNWVTTLFIDSRNRLWAGTRGGGLHRFDRETDDFTVFRTDPDDPNSLSKDGISAIAEDSAGMLWIGVKGGALNRLDPETGKIQRFGAGDDPNRSLGGDHVRSLAFDRQGFLWVGTSYNGLDRFDPRTGEFVHFRPDPGVPGALSHNWVQSLLVDNLGVLWAATLGGGLNRYEPTTGSFVHYRHDPADPDSLSDDSIWTLFQDSNGALWVGGQDNGLNRMTDDGARFIRYNHDPLRADSLSHDKIWSLWEDASGILWVGTRGGGVSKLDLRSELFGHYKHEYDNERSLVHNWVNCLYEDEDGALWIGSIQGLDKMEPGADGFRHYVHDPDDPQSLGHDHVQTLSGGRGGELWVGTLGGGVSRMDIAAGTFETYRHIPNDADSLPQDLVMAIHHDRRGLVWIGMDGAGLSVLDPETDRFTHYVNDENDPGSLPKDVVISLFEDRDNEMWCGTLGGGLSRFDRDARRFDTWTADADNPASISNDVVISIDQGRDGSLWLGTFFGLCRFQPDTGLSTCYFQPDGLPGEIINAVVVDDDNFVWASTDQGLSRFDPVSETFRNYYAQDGLQSNEFSSAAVCKRRDGRLAFGGPNGFNLFHPRDIKEDRYTPPIVITDFQIFNKPVPLKRDREDSPLTRVIEETEELRLSYRDYVFSFEFAALDLGNPRKNRYAYKLENFNEDWVTADAGKRFATYTKLDPGHYVFRVRGAAGEGPWNNEGASVKLYIAPPPWKTWWAYLAYAASIIAILSAYSIAQKRKLATERSVNERLKQVDKLKDEFLANTSHELRTPLNGMIGLAESLRDGVAGDLPSKALHDLSMIVSSGKRLTSLVNDILDFSKLKNRSLELNRQAVDLRSLVDVTLTLSKPLLGRKDLVLSNSVPAYLPPVDADENRLQQILHNLVGNAVKFTEQGFVKVSARLDDDHHVVITVADTGIGIEPEKLDLIFESFEQGDASTSRVYGGTGLGLAVTRQLVELHNGRIWAQSTIGMGSIFTFLLPIYEGKRPSPAALTLSKLDAVGTAALEPAEPAAMPVAAEPAAMPEAANAEPAAEAQPADHRILVVDDEPVNRQVLANLLALRRYQLTEVSSGHEALWEIERRPHEYDLVLLDVMMPRMSGFEVCRKLRERYSVHELPIIFLTAKNQVSDLVEAFNSGGNDYLTKPIEKGELLSRVDMHLELLELNRDLERKVADRTHELNEKNFILDSKYKELETLDRIVKTINREVELKNVINTLLEQGLSLFSKAERGSFLIFDPSCKQFRFVASAGFDFALLKDIAFSKEELVRRYADESEQREKGVYIASHFKRRNQPPLSPDLPEPESVIAMTVPLNGELAALLALDNPTDPEAFQTSDVKKLTRFREHAVSAVSKAKVFKDLVETQRKLVEAAHTAGMAEIAASVLHNMGNTLNSVKVSAHVVNEQASETKWLELLGKISELLALNERDLAAFFKNDPRARELPGALTQILRRLETQRGLFQRESDRLIERVGSMTAVLQEQQKHTRAKDNLSELADLNELALEALHMEVYLLSDRRVNVVKYLQPLPLIKVQKTKILRVLFCLLKNAWESIAEKDEQSEGLIEVSTFPDKNGVRLELSDNGAGIPAERLGQIFAHGFTTKPGNRGFGLHYCANAMKEMSGSIRMFSDGEGAGAKVALWFPATLQPPEPAKLMAGLVEEMHGLSELSATKN